jgi:hypothetical protein
VSVRTIETHKGDSFNNFGSNSQRYLC